MIRYLLAAAVACTVSADDCTPPLEPWSVVRTYDGYWQNTVGSVVTNTREIDTVYTDNRLNVGYGFEISGTNWFTNPTSTARIIRHRLDIPAILLPTHLSIDLVEDVCVEDDGTLVVLIERRVEPGETLEVDWSGYVRWVDPYSGSDLNGDYSVDAEDLALLLAAWGTADPFYDLNGDGVVNGPDQGILLSNWTDSSD